MLVTWRQQDFDLVWPLTIEKKIDIFYEQIRGWQLHVADLIANGGSPLGSGSEVQRIPDSGFAVLQICLSYLETIGKYQPQCRGRTSSAQFQAGAQEVFPELKSIDSEVRRKLLDVLYVRARCGLYHNSRTCHGVGLGQPPNGDAIAYIHDLEVLVISPERFPKALKNHLERYRAALLDPANAVVRRYFETQFDKDFGGK